MKKELVISAYERDYKEWIKYLNPDVKVTVYRKGENRNDPSEIFLENNVGQDVHTFFLHIVNRYDTLSDYTIFSQDFPFDHVQNYLDIINGNPALWEIHAKMKIGDYYAFSTASALVYEGMARSLGFPESAYTGKTLICKENGYPHHRPNELNIASLWPLFFESPVPESFEFVPAGHFLISKEQIRTKSVDFYKKVVHELETRWKCPYEVERLESYIFNPQVK